MRSWATVQLATLLPSIDQPDLPGSPMQLSELRNLDNENVRLKGIIAEFELDKLILKNSLNHSRQFTGPSRRT